MPDLFRRAKTEGLGDGKLACATGVDVAMVEGDGEACTGNGGRAGCRIT